MEAFTQLTGLVAPIDRPNIDTDAIIPKQYLKSIRRSGFGVNLFDDWRYLDPGEPGMDHSQRRLNPDFILNQPRYNNTRILLGRDNFGCGSSREHAVWALIDYGIRAILAPSFADIFYNNSFKNGLLPIVLAADMIEQLFADVAADDGYRLTIDLAQKTITLPDGGVLDFAIEDYRRQRLLHGLDDIALSLQNAAAIRQYEQRRQQQAPWLFATPGAD